MTTAITQAYILSYPDQIRLSDSSLSLFIGTYSYNPFSHDNRVFQVTISKRFVGICLLKALYPCSLDLIYNTCLVLCLILYFLKVCIVVYP